MSESTRERIALAQRRMNDRAAAQWHRGRGLNQSPTHWNGAHPLVELVHEMADAQNYLLLAKSEDRTIPADLVRALEALSLTFELRLMDLEATGRDLSRWTLPPHLRAVSAPAGAPSASSDSSIRRSSSAVNSVKSPTK